MEKSYCADCDEFVDYDIKEEVRKITVRDVEVEATVKSAICKKCGGLVSAYDVEVWNDISVFDEYKKKVGLMTTKELVANRERLGMNQEEFAKYLGLSLKDVQRYEHGKIQTKEIDELFKSKLIMNTEEARKYKCSVRTEEYGKGDVEFVSEFREFPNIIGAGLTEQEAIDEGYENLQVYLDYCKDEKIDYPKPID